MGAVGSVRQTPLAVIQGGLRGALRKKYASYSGINHSPELFTKPQSFENSLTNKTTRCFLSVKVFLAESACEEYI